MPIAGGPEANDKPRIIINPGGSQVVVPNAKIGLRGRDDEDARVDPDDEDSEPLFHWFYSPGDRHVAMNSNLVSPAHVSYNTPLAATDRIQVTYFGQADILVQADNLSEQTARAAVEGGGGIYEELESDESIDGLESAVERAQGILARFDQIRERLNIETDLLGYHAGQMMSPAFADYGIAGDWIQERVEVEDVAGAFLRTRLELTNADYFAAEWEFWRRMAAQGRKFQARETERLHILRHFLEAISLSEVATIQTGNQLDPEADDDSSLQDGMLQHGGIMNGGEVF
jgi:hypothetical protein